MSDETTPQVPQPASDTSSEMNAADTDSSDNSRPEPTASSDKANAVSSAISNTAPDSATAIAPASPVSQSRWQRTKTLWQGLLALVRSRLPASWQPRLSNGVLSALFLGVGCLFFDFCLCSAGPDNSSACQAASSRAALRCTRSG
ncbi:MAG: hypothetical protein HC886_18700 [Leptolyngbyaceae cyanobacterium SM1_1_3]|nr:hypothetical protein [Leptolyngbyaceae cyanobacterium SM1_1_3]